MSDETGAARAVVVIGASGGCGTSLLAGGLALAWQRQRPGAWLIELDPNGGDLAEAWDLPGDRTLDDLAAVSSEVADHHLRTASREHPSGVLALVGGAASGGARWDEGSAGDLVTAARGAAGRGRVAVDGGCGLGETARGIAGRADGVLIVCAPRLSGARRARGILAGLAAAGDDGRCALVVAHGPRRGELGARALSRAVGAPVVGELPWAEREADDLSAGRWPRGRRARLAAAVAAVARAAG